MSIPIDRASRKSPIVSVINTQSCRSIRYERSNIWNLVTLLTATSLPSTRSTEPSRASLAKNFRIDFVWLEDTMATLYAVASVATACAMPGNDRAVSIARSYAPMNARGGTESITLDAACKFMFASNRRRYSGRVRPGLNLLLISKQMSTVSAITPSKSNITHFCEFSSTVFVACYHYNTTRVKQSAPEKSDTTCFGAVLLGVF